MTGLQQKKGDGHTTMLAHIQTHLNSTLKKRYDRNHNVKNIGKNMYAVKKTLVKVFYTTHTTVP